MTPSSAFERARDEGCKAFGAPPAGIYLDNIEPMLRAFMQAFLADARVIEEVSVGVADEYMLIPKNTPFEDVTERLTIAALNALQRMMVK